MKDENDILENRRSGLIGLMSSVRAAIRGILIAVRQERNLQIHLLATLVVIIAGRYFKVSQTEWLVLLLTISLVLVAELLNSAIEKTLDRIGQEDHPLTRDAKDIAAGAVLMSSLFAILVGGIVFLPHCLN